MIKSVVNVVYSSSDLYAQCTGISILSLLDNNKDIEKLDLYIIDTDISIKNKKNIEKIAHSYERTITFISAKETLEKSIKSMNLKSLRGAYNTYSRLKLNEWLNNLDKVLVIDSDTLIVGSIKELWNTDLQDNLIASVPEIGVYLPKNTFEDTEIINKNKFYYNAGIGLYNLKKWREDNIDELIAEKINDYGKEFSAAEQSVLNYSIGDRIMRIHLKYNYYTFIHGVKLKTLRKIFSEKEIFSKEEFNTAQTDAVIIHFVGFPFERPWYTKNVSSYSSIYQEYRDKSPWSGMELMPVPSPKNIVFGVYDCIIKTLKYFKLYSLALWVRCVLGQKIKSMTKQKR